MLRSNMEHHHKTECFSCLSSSFLKWMRLLQPVVIMKCPHKDKNVKKVQIEISHFWSNIQIITMPFYVKALYDAYKKYLTSNTEEDYMFNFGRICAFLSLHVCLFFLFNQKKRLYELQMLQNIFDVTSKSNLPSILNVNAVKDINLVNTRINIYESVWIALLVGYILYTAYKTSQYLFCTIELLVTISSFNILLFYAYIYYIACKAFENWYIQIFNCMNARLTNCQDDSSMMHTLKKYVDVLKLLMRTVEMFLSFRGFPILLVTVCILVCNVTVMYGAIRHFEVVLREEFYFRGIQISFVFILHQIMCVLASMVLEQVSIRLEA